MLWVRQQFIDPIRRLTGDVFYRSVIPVRLAQVTKPLASVSSICNRGNRVIFDSGGSYIQNKTSQKTRSTLRDCTTGP